MLWFPGDGNEGSGSTVNSLNCVTAFADNQANHVVRHVHLNTIILILRGLHLSLVGNYLFEHLFHLLDSLGGTFDEDVSVVGTDSIFHSYLHSSCA